MSPRSSLLFLLTLSGAFTGMGGCFSADVADRCFLVPWPVVGSSVSYHYSVKSGNNSGFDNFTIGDVVYALRGDGLRVPALALKKTSAIGFVSLDDKDHLGGNWIGHNWFELNYEGTGMSGPLLFGECLTEGQIIQKKYLDPDGRLQITVLESTARALTVDIQVPQSDGMQNGTQHYRATWLQSSPFADRVIVYHSARGPEEPAVVNRLVLFSGGTSASPPSYKEPRSDAESPSPGTPPATRVNCTALPMRQPDLHALPVEVPFQAFLDNLSTDRALVAFVRNHPGACAAVTAFEQVNEPNSTASVWSTVYADPRGSQFFKQYVVRCFHDALLATIYGECEERDRYDAMADIGSSEGGEGLATQWIREPDVQRAVLHLERLVGQPFTRFIWRVQGEVSGDFLRPIVGKGGEGRMEADFGVLEYEVRYVSATGDVTPTGGHMNSRYVRLAQSGWVTHAPDDLLRSTRWATN